MGAVALPGGGDIARLSDDRNDDRCMRTAAGSGWKDAMAVGCESDNVQIEVGNRNGSRSSANFK